VSRDPRILLEDILESIERIEEYVSGLSVQTFDQDSKSQDAVLLRFQVIGQAVKGLPQSFRASHPEVSWREVAATRDVIVHEYFRVDFALVWDMISNDIPSLKANVMRILDEMA
jgi:uncharacterized protein with HEPN domain